MKKNNRGRGFAYQPTYTERQADGTKVTKHSAGWWISYSIRGKRHRENAHSTNHADAMRLLNQRHGEAQQGKPVGAQIERTTLNDLLAMVQANYIANGRRSLTRARFAFPHLRAFFGADAKARDVTSDRITAYAANRLGQGVKPATVNFEMAMLRRGFSLAKDGGKVASSPKFAMLHLDNTRKGFFEREQFEAVLRYLPEYFRPVAQVAYMTGWRARSELLTRQWKDVDFEHGWLRLEVGETKSGAGRAFPFGVYPELRAVLEAQRERVREMERATGRIIPWVFPKGDGSKLVSYDLFWRKARRAAGIPGRLMHDFRRTAVRNLERAGVSRSAAMKLTGHATESVYQRYAIVDSTMLEEGVAKLAAFGNSQSRAQVLDFATKKVL
jgi:integrase